MEEAREFPVWKRWFTEDEAASYTGRSGLEGEGGLDRYHIGRQTIYDRRQLDRLIGKRGRRKEGEDKQLFSFKEACEYTGVPEGSMPRYIYSLGHIKPLLVARSAVFTREQLDDFVTNNGHTDITPDKDRYLSSTEAAEYLNISAEYLGQLVHIEKKIEATKVGAHLVYTRDELDRYLGRDEEGR